ncbi:MAG: glycosyltransferase family protein [Alphaproteobacteria bacterium]|nr:glycosyltransferase family protein [Alphaproteobacteria bacterium]
MEVPASIDAWIDLCAAAEKRGDYAEVLRAGDALARLAGQSPQPHFIRGLALQRLGRMDESIDAYRAATARDPNSIDAWTNLGFACQELNRINEAEDAYRRAAECGAPPWNLAVIELLKGDLQNGFAHYEARFSANGKQRPDFPQPLWRGEDLKGKTILITVDQGHGDTLMMARFFPVLRERGARIVLQAQPALAPYLENWDGVDAVLSPGDPLPAFDYHANEFDLPRYLGTTLETLPAQIPYLPVPEPDKATRLPDTGNMKVALTWAGNPNHVNDAQRSLTLADLNPLFDVQGVDFYALTRDKKPGDEELLHKLSITDLAPKLGDFLTTARYLAQCDLVISCDTATAHLAGGMGKPLWVMLPFAPAWCWLTERKDSPWYPTARLFRQQTRGDWRGVAAHVAEALREKL